MSEDAEKKSIEQNLSPDSFDWEQESRAILAALGGLLSEVILQLRTQERSIKFLKTKLLETQYKG